MGHFIFNVLVIIALSIVPHFVSGFAPTSLLFPSSRSTPGILSIKASEGGWVSLTEDHAVKKKIIKEGSSKMAEKGSEVEVEYVGTLIGEANWTVEDVTECWLANQQGLYHLRDAFVNQDINGMKLMDTDFLTEEFVAAELGVSNKIACKKLVLAARRLSKQQDDFPAGLEFDSSKEKGPFKFILGEGNAIKAYEVAVPTMSEGEVAKIISRCDYAYGSEGYRKRDGTVVVPPFSTLCFEVTLLKC